MSWGHAEKKNKKHLVLRFFIVEGVKPKTFWKIIHGKFPLFHTNPVVLGDLESLEEQIKDLAAFSEDGNL